jgi:hypothetical protein
MQRAPDQIPANIQYFRTIENTTWLYPIEDINVVLNSTTVPHTFDGTNLVCESMAGIIALYAEMVAQTGASQPIGNTGYSLGVGTQLIDMGNEIIWQLPGGVHVIRWRNMFQLTPQAPSTVIPAPGNSPQGTVGYGTVWASYQSLPTIDFELPLFVRVG